MRNRPLLPRNSPNMFRRTVHLSLIAVLLGCPPSCFLRSMLVETSESDAAAASHVKREHIAGGCCCHKARSARTEPRVSPNGDESTSRPVPRPAPRPCDDDNPCGGSCQCICGGAVVDDHVAYDVADAMHALDVLALVPQTLFLVPAETGIRDGRWLADDDILSGREICRLHALMLC